MEIFGIGLGEVLVVAVVALIILGPDRLPEAARTLGKGIADFRRAIEPARNAWVDVTREFTDTVQDARSQLTQVTTAGAPITGNPWKVHPLAEGLSDEERELYFKTGALPEWKLAEITAKNDTPQNGKGPVISDEPAELDYPMPHTAQSGTRTHEELYYPEPHHIKSKEELGG